VAFSVTFDGDPDVVELVVPEDVVEFVTEEVTDVVVDEELLLVEAEEMPDVVLLAGTAAEVDA
jgi:hypothetical protein